MTVEKHAGVTNTGSARVPARVACFRCRFGTDSSILLRILRALRLRGRWKDRECVLLKRDVAVRRMAGVQCDSADCRYVQKVLKYLCVTFVNNVL